MLFSDPGQITVLAQKNVDYPGDLSTLVSKDIVSKFSPGSLVGCKVGNKLYCLRNDIAQIVLWYNAAKMKEFGYSTPDTWEEYEALGVRVAKEHPGYIVGSFGDAQAYNMFFPGGSCPVQQLIGESTVKINLQSPNCTRVANLIDNLLTAGSLSKFGPFDAEYIKLANDNKILMMPAASWYGEFVFKAAYKTPANQLSVALPLRWSNERSRKTGAQGGAAFAISSHSKNPKAAADIVLWMSTSLENQTDAPTQPAYEPAAEAWGKKLGNDKFYKTNPYPVLKESAKALSPLNSYVRYDTVGTFANIVVTGVKAGKTVTSLLEEYGKQVEELAKVAGYRIIK